MSLELSRVTMTLIFLEPNHRAAAARDPDDNEYVDAYVAAQADLLISNNSKDFSVLKNIDFPPINWKTVRQVKKSMFA